MCTKRRGQGVESKGGAYCRFELLTNSFDTRKYIAKYFDKTTCNALKSVARGLKPKLDRTPVEAAVYCKTEAGRTEVDEESEEDMTCMIKGQFKNKKGFRASSAASSEASFTEKYIMPSIRRFLLKDASQDHNYAMIDKPGKNCKKPDFMIEVKRPGATSKYQADDDHTKLMKQVKGSVDAQLRLGFKTFLSWSLG
ncbi:hypothetical protein CU097_011328 [Rhizopus azygosporus]|uniref:Uncharacterized protein n=1 Tax=Rhizopus azygosporus TaxID=86630 RepID=A0A367JR89_RHIAZ|nr:hypothetical protein CU097_011328 [Rhizopus azygosporus]